jgi:protocatechuate 3,4-dioxygenase beta subunit
MRNGRRFILFAAVLAGIPALAVAAERLTINGRVTDASGKPLDHATVMVYEAGVRTGYSLYCPTCYVDCGKHAFHRY